MAERLERICIFCGSSSGARAAYSQAAAHLGGLLAARGIGLVYGGSHLGLMGKLADTVLSAGGSVTGVMPRLLVEKEAAHTGLPDLRVVGSMHERKALMADLADGFIALPGAYGTLDELCEILTWAQLGVHSKPCGMLNVENFFDPLLQFLDHAVAERFLRPENRDLVIVDYDAERLLDRMAAFQAPRVDKWIGREEV